MATNLFMWLQQQMNCTGVMCSIISKSTRYGAVGIKVDDY